MHNINELPVDIGIVKSTCRHDDIFTRILRHEVIRDLFGIDGMHNLGRDAGQVGEFRLDHGGVTGIEEG